MSAHTPGPWSIDESPVDYLAIRGPDNAPVWLKSIADVDVLGNDEEQERVARANARLIAVAPELLGLVSDARRLLRDAPITVQASDWRRRADAILAAAEGREP